MSIYNLLILGCWVVFLLYWTVAARGAKDTLSKPTIPRKLWTHVFVVIILFLLLRSEPFQPFFHRYWDIVPNDVFKTIGVAFCATGIAYAIWARVHIGKNWGMPMSIKASPELITSGPYAYVRHPIYTGVIFAALGTIFVSGPIWIFPIALFAIYFFHSAQKEEELLIKQFPDDYPAYMKKTKMLIPFLF